MGKEELEKYDRMYGDFNQDETRICKILEERKHPNAGEYRTLRNFFDTLKHYANSGARFYSFEDHGECTEYWAPKLRVRYTGGIFPCHGQRYYDLLRESPVQELGPYLDAGSWIVQTRNEKFFNAIEELEGAEGIHVSYKDVPAGHKRAFTMRPHNAYNYFSATVFLDNLKQFEIVKAVIDRFVEPLRKEEEDEHGV